MRTWIPLLALVICPLPGCLNLGGGVICTANVVSGVNATVTNAATGAPVAGATLTLTEGDYSEVMEEIGSPSGMYVGAGERAGTYTLTVEADGFVSQTIDNIVVEGGQCHVTPVSLEIALTPS